MATTNNFQTFQFFPPPPIPSVPKIAMPNPHNRQPSLNRNLFPQTGTLVRTEKGESVIIKVEDLRSDSLDSTSSQDSKHIVVPASQLDGRSRTPTPQPPKPALVRGESSASKKYTPSEFRHLTNTPPDSPESGSPTLVRGNSSATRGQTSPIPLRSMFPVYNPTIPLSQQSYYPQRGTSLQAGMVSKNTYSIRVATPSQFDIATGGPRTAPASVCDLSSEIASLPEMRYSSQAELEKLWQATHGMEATAEIGSFDLEMSRLQEAIFTFGPDPLAPFYTLKTFDTNEIALAKTSPRKKATCEILQSTLEPQERRHHDGLVTMIFPRLAAMLAIDQATELARQHSLAPTHKDEVVAAALERAANQEACRLIYNPTCQRYELEHPAIGRNARNPEFAVSPVSPQSNAKPVLHVTVSPNSPAVPMLSPTRPPVIIVTNPNAISSSPDPAGPGIRASAMPQPDIDNPLASLDFGNMTLHIDAQQILELMPSLFAIDSIISAILAVAISDPAVNPAMAEMELWTATTTPRIAPSVFGGQSVMSYTGSQYYATLAEREEAEEEARLMKLVHDKDVKNKTAKSKPKKEKKAKKSKKVEMAEFDLEKLGHYQGGSRKGEELPAVSRGAVEMLISGLKLVVWLLTASVQLLVWIITHVSRAVTSEKF